MKGKHPINPALLHDICLVLMERDTPPTKWMSFRPYLRKTHRNGSLKEKAANRNLIRHALESQLDSMTHHALLKLISRAFSHYMHTSPDRIRLQIQYLGYRATRCAFNPLSDEEKDQ